MSESRLPPRASIEFLKKLAKEQLRELRKKDPSAKLSRAQLAIARRYGFASWRAMKAAVEAQGRKPAAVFVEACEVGEIITVQAMLGEDPALVKAVHPDRPHGGWTALHGAAQKGQSAIVNLLIERGADVNA